MKPAPFEYLRPQTLEEAIAALAADADALILSGGQTLVAMLNMRLARPSAVIDIAHVPGLAGIARVGDALRIGAMTRQVEVERSALVAERAPLLAEAIGWVGHAPTRARGTVGGSVANADPSAEIALVLVTLGGVVELTGPHGMREVAAGDFFLGPMATSREASEIVTAVRVPAHCHGIGFGEIATRRSDYALVSAAAVVEVEGGRCARVHAGIGGAPGRPVAVDLQELVGAELTDGAIARAAEAAAQAIPVEPPPHTSEAYCRRAAARLLEQALIEAREAA